ncbi:GNAT family N-acetyltransferase [Streptomyces lunaelactis]|nr:GNAT family N-acetyltransferase [Streptomyces lunaelactis]
MASVCGRSPSRFSSTRTAGAGLPARRAKGQRLQQDSARPPAGRAGREGDPRLPRRRVPRRPGNFLGWLSLRPATSVGLDGGTELGYRMLPSVWGLGYATEGAQALVHHAFTELGVDRIVATTMTVNTASRRVMEKAGLSLIRTFFEQWPEPIEGAEHGDVEYAVTRETWTRQHDHE